jgi:hypothetical protein
LTLSGSNTTATAVNRVGSLAAPVLRSPLSSSSATPNTIWRESSRV